MEEHFTIRRFCEKILNFVTKWEAILHCESPQAQLYSKGYRVGKQKHRIIQKEVSFPIQLRMHFGARLHVYLK